MRAQTCDYQQQKENLGEPEPASPSFIEKVSLIHSGLPRFVVSHTATQPVQEIREWFQQRLSGQKAAIEAVIDTITC